MQDWLKVNLVERKPSTANGEPSAPLVERAR
jgi:hypothetical protein